MDHDQTPQAVAPALHAPVAESYEAIEQIQIVAPGPGDSGGVSVVQPPSTSAEPLLGAASEGRHTLPRPHENPNTDFERVSPPLPACSRDGHARAHPTSRSGLASNFGFHLPRHRDSGLDWIVPVDEKDHSPRTVGERLKPTIDEACRERQKCARKVKWTNYSLNFAIGLQVFLGALTTGISAALTSARNAQIATAILGGFSTLVASFLARARGSGEPELSSMRLQDLEHFLRGCAAFQTDHAHAYATPENRLDHRLDDFRRELEEILGNTPGERKVPPFGITATAIGAVPPTRPIV